MRQNTDMIVRESVHLHIKGSPGWVRWVTGLAKRERTTNAGLVDKLLADHAQRVGHESPPERCGR